MLLCALAFAAGRARADLDLGPATAEGEFVLGYQGVSGDFRSSKFDQYRDMRPGELFAGFATIEDDARRFYLYGDFNALSENQSYHLRAGRYGWLEIDAALAQFYQDYSHEALTPYGSGAFLALPAGWVLTNDSAPQIANMAAFGRSTGLRFRQRNYDGGIRWWASEELLLRARYGLVERDGTQPFALQWGSPGGRYASFRAPVDDRIHAWLADASLFREDWSARLGYDGQHYVNHAGSATVENPTLQGFGVQDPVGRVSRAPDNTQDRVSLEGALRLPFATPVRFAGTVSYGRLGQEDDFLPHSANPGGANPALPQSDLDGRVDTVLTNLVLTARPRDGLSLRARYRFYDWNNGTDTIAFSAQVLNDNETAGAGAVADQRDFRRQTASLSATQALPGAARATLDYTWNNWYRERRERTHTNDHAVGLTLEGRLGARAQLRGRYEFATRSGNTYESATTGLRMFDEADRDRHRVDLSATLRPGERSWLAVSGGYAHSDYQDLQFGLDEVVWWSAGAEYGFRASERVEARAWYTFERTRWRQLGSSGGGFTGRNTDLAHDAGAVLELAILPGRLHARLTSEYHWGRAETRASGATAVDYPSLKDNLTVLSAGFEYQLSEHWRFEWGYRFERWNGTDFRYDDVGVVPPDGSTGDLLLRDRVEDYEANIFLGSFAYEF